MGAAVQRHFGCSDCELRSSRDGLPMKAAHRSGRGSGQRFIGPAHPADEAPSGPRPQKRVQINRQLHSFFLRGHLTPLSRTLVSTRESIPFRVPPSSQCFQGGKPAFLKFARRAKFKFHGRGFHQTTTISLARLELLLALCIRAQWLGRRQSAKWLKAGRMGTREGT